MLLLRNVKFPVRIQIPGQKRSQFVNRIEDVLLNAIVKIVGPVKESEVLHQESCYVVVQDTTSGLAVIVTAFNRLARVLNTMQPGDAINVAGSYAMGGKGMVFKVGRILTDDEIPYIADESVTTEEEEQAREFERQAAAVGSFDESAYADAVN